MEGVSVIICCYNSAARIVETLRHLASQVISPRTQWELILVDNASTDNTSEVANNVWPTFNNQTAKFIVTQQPIPGLVHARTKGIQMASYDVVIFCDDDNRLNHNYIETAIKLLQSGDAAIICGYGIAVSGQSFPDWFRYVFTFYACHSIDGQQLLSRPPEELQYGAGMVIRKSFLTQIATSGYTYYLKDRSGTKLSSGQDTELILLAKILGKKVITSDKLKFHHYIPDTRLSKHYLYRLIQGVCFNGFKLEPFKIYYLNKKPLTNVTWLKDTLYVAKYFIQSLGSYIVNNSFEKKIGLMMNWYALQCSITNYNQYKAIGERLDSLRTKASENPKTIKHVLR